MYIVYTHCLYWHTKKTPFCPYPSLQVMSLDYIIAAAVYPLILIICYALSGRYVQSQLAACGYHVKTTSLFFCHQLNNKTLLVDNFGRLSNTTPHLIC